MKRCGSLFLMFTLFLSFNIHALDRNRLQHGARMFSMYCSGCHTLKYLRYSPIAPDYPLQTNLPEQEAKRWFGKIPPDLSLTARQRGRSWIVGFLTQFYPDADITRPFHVNNRLIHNVSMPDVLGPLNQQVSPKEYERTVEDIALFLTVVAEPARLTRYSMGCFVLIFLMCFGVLWVQLKPQKRH